MYVVPHIDHHPSDNEFNADIWVIKLGNNFSLTKCCDDDVVVQCQHCRSYQTRADGGNRRKRKHVSEMQSTDINLPTDTPVQTDVVAENIKFTDEALSERLDLGTLSQGNYDADMDSAAGLASYLSRPVRIANITWAESTATQTSILPWHLYFNTTQIKNKLQNYGKISCRLHLKFIVNASPFYYGSIRACWFPLGDKRSTYANIVDQIPFSQVPGVFLEPQNMSTAEMVLPFVWQHNWLEVTKATDFQRMGVLQFLQYANLRSANGVSGSGITIGVYAWAEDVKLMGPTSIAALQSTEYDMPNGVISEPASAVANVAAKLKSVPIVAPFATATEIGARAVAGVAKLFGYSNPPVIDDVQPFHPKSFHAFANVETRFPADKLCIDPKNETTISRGTIGLEDDGDELAIQRLFGHESFLQGTNWSNSQATDTLLWSALVTPGYVVSGGGYYVQPPMSYFGQLFRFWRGSIIYKFRFIKTKYHKGRVIISYDPNGDTSANADTETTCFTRIVDLSVDEEVEIEVPYKATSPWNEVETHSTAFSNGTSPSYTYNSVYHNGCITMRVQNVLTGPAASPQIDVLVFVRAGKDFQVAAPVEMIRTLTVADPAASIQSNDIALSDSSLDTRAAIMTTGESIGSLRTLLHRTTLIDTQPTLIANAFPVASPARFFSKMGFWRIPRGPGRDPNGYDVTYFSGVARTTSLSYPNYIDYISNAFVGVRGSVNHSFNLQKLMGTSCDELSVTRTYSTPILQSTATPYNVTDYYTTSGATNLENTLLRYNFVRSGQSGMSLTNPNTQSALCVNVPQYNKIRFYPAFYSQRSLDVKTGTSFFDELVVSTLISYPIINTGQADCPQIWHYASGGVDFQPLMFLCVPRTFDFNPAAA